MKRSWLKSHWFSLLLTALVLVVAIPKYRHGMIRVDGIDLAMPYACTRAWLNRENPYDADILTRTFNEAGGQDFKDFNLKFLPPIYPPITFIVMTPISLLRWDQAVRAWEMAAPIMAAILIGTVLKLAGIEWRDPRVILFILFCIVFAPLRSAVTLAQNALPAVCAGTLAVLALSRRRDSLAGCLLAISVAFKLQDAIFVLVCFSLLRRWRAIAWCIGILALMSIIAIARMGLSEPGWIFDVLSWIRQAALPGAIIDPAAPNPARFQMLHLPVLLFTVLSSRMVVTIVNWIVCGTLGVATCVLIVRNQAGTPAAKSDLLSLSTLGLVSLLPIYHRFPDAIILLLPLAWAVRRLGTPDEGTARVILLLLLPFLLQPYEVLRSLVSSGTLSRAMYDARWFQCLVRASLIWVLLALACWLVMLLRSQTHGERRNQQVPNPPAG